MGGQKIIQLLREGIKPADMGMYAARSIPLARRAAELYGAVDPANLTPERLTRAAAGLTEKVYRSAADRVLGKSKVDGNYRSQIRGYVQKVLAGDNLGAEVNEVTANWLSDLEYEDVNVGKRGKSPLGFNENAGGRTRVYIPRVGENVGMIVSQGMQDYIRIHELIETVKAPRGEQQHEKMDAAILDVLREFSKTSTRARQAYRGALSVYEARGDADPYFRGVSKFYPVREEISSNIFSTRNSNEGVQRFALAA